MYRNEFGLGFGPRKYGIYFSDCWRALKRGKLRSWIHMCIHDKF